MDPQERILKALQGDACDRPPFICPGGMMSMMTVEAMSALSACWPQSHNNAAEMARLARGVQELTGIENLGVPYCMTVEAEALGARISLGTPESEPRVAAYPLTTLDEWERLGRLSEGSGRLGTVAEAIAILSSQQQPYPIIANLTGPISLATSLLEPMVFFKAMGKQPLRVHAFLNYLTENLIVFGRLMLQAGAQIVTIADPSASGEILGPKRFAEFALPYINALLDALENDCQASLVHICGNLKPVFSKLPELHTRAISIDSATSVTALREALADDQVIVGNVSTQLLLNGTQDQVQRASQACLQRGARLLAPACGISPYTPLRNMQAMAKSARSTNSDLNGVESA